MDGGCVQTVMCHQDRTMDLHPSSSIDFANGFESQEAIHLVRTTNIRHPIRGVPSALNVLGRHLPRFPPVPSFQIHMEGASAVWSWRRAAGTQREPRASCLPHSPPQSRLRHIFRRPQEAQHTPCTAARIPESPTGADRSSPLATGPAPPWRGEYPFATDVTRLSIKDDLQLIAVLWTDMRCSD